MITVFVFSGLVALAAIGWLAFAYFHRRESQWNHEEQLPKVQQ